MWESGKGCRVKRSPSETVSHWNLLTSHVDRAPFKAQFWTIYLAISILRVLKELERDSFTHHMSHMKRTFYHHVECMCLSAETRRKDGGSERMFFRFWRWYNERIMWKMSSEEDPETLTSPQNLSRECWLQPWLSTAPHPCVPFQQPDEELSCRSCRVPELTISIENWLNQLRIWVSLR